MTEENESNLADLDRFRTRQTRGSRDTGKVDLTTAHVVIPFGVATRNLGWRLNIGAQQAKNN